MSKLHGERNFLYENDGITSYAVLPVDAWDRIIYYQSEMIAVNKMPSILPFSIRQMDNQTFINYNITSKVSLLQFLKRKALNKDEFLDMIRQVAKTILESAGYMLKPSSFLLDESCIYISPATMKLSLMYVPVERETDINEEYKELIVRIITKLSTITDAEGDNFLHKIICQLRQENFFIEEFFDFINKLRAQPPVHEPGENPIIKKTENTSISSRVPLLMGQALLFLITTSILLMLRNYENKDLCTYGGVLIIAASLELLLLRSIKFRGGKKKPMEENKTNRKAGGKQKENIPKDLMDMKNSSAGTYSPVGGIYENGVCETMVVNTGASSLAYLQSMEIDPPVKVNIDEISLVIGRLKEHADFVLPYKTIGKLHAEITLQEGHYYITDMNSKNGTYVNNVRISNNSPCEIKNADVIGLADIRFQFKTG